MLRMVQLTIKKRFAIDTIFRKIQKHEIQSSSYTGAQVDDEMLILETL